VLLGATAPALMFLLWSCNSHRLEGPDPNPTGESAQYRDINPISAIDIVFVVDNSGSMSQEQANLGRNFPVFMQQLAALQGGDFRIGVVNTDLGGGATTMNGECAPTTPGGDGGRFCHVRGVDYCARCGVDASQGRFLRTVNPNLMGDLPGVFTCMASMGTSGCSFEHSLGALQKSLTLPENGDFVRPNAYLAFVIITDEEDCTAPPDSDMFATPDPAGDWSLRCYTEAVVCNGAHPTAAASSHMLDQCQVANDGKLIPVNQLVQSILALKNNDPTMVIAAGIFGWPLPQNVANARHQIASGGQGGTFTMQPVCNSPGNGNATPGYRVKSFVESFPNHEIISICEGDFSGAMRRLGEKIRATVGPPCVTERLYDIDRADGLQVDCAVTEKIPVAGGGVEERVVPSCAAAPNGVCWNLVENAQCTASRRLIEIERRDGSQPVEGTRQSMRCLTCTDTMILEDSRRPVNQRVCPL
jgi:hypothetical protein